MLYTNFDTPGTYPISSFDRSWCFINAGELDQEVHALGPPGARAVGTVTSLTASLGNQASVPAEQRNADTYMWNPAKSSRTPASKALCSPKSQKSATQTPTCLIAVAVRMVIRIVPCPTLEYRWLWIALTIALREWSAPRSSLTGRPRRSLPFNCCVAMSVCELLVRWTKQHDGFLPV